MNASFFITISKHVQLRMSMVAIMSILFMPEFAFSKAERATHDRRDFSIGCEKPYLITQKDFVGKKNKSKSFKIGKSGHYKLCESICYKPCKKKTAAIVIDANNVTLDLGGFVLSQGNDVLQTIGIHVKTGHENITILGSNGVITNFSQLGLYVEGGNKHIQLGNDEAQLHINKNGGKSAVSFGSALFAGFISGNVLTVTEIFGGTIEIGMNIVGAFGASLVPETLISAFGTGTGGTGTYIVNNAQNVADSLIKGDPVIEGGIQLGDTFWFEKAGFTKMHGIIAQAVLNNVICDENSPIGINLGNLSSTTFIKSSFSRNTDSRLSAAVDFLGFGCMALGGFMFASPVYGDVGWNNLVLDSISCSENSANPFDESLFALCWGLGIGEGGSQADENGTSGKGLIIRNSLFNNNHTGKANDAQVRGFAMGASGNVFIEKTEFCANYGGGRVEGFHQSGYVPGIVPEDDVLIQCRSISLNECTASNNRSTAELWGSNPAKFQRARGYTFFYTDGLTVTNSVAHHNTVQSLGRSDDEYSGRAMGFYITGDLFNGLVKDARNVLLNNVHVSGNCCDATMGDALSMGIYFEDTLGRSLVVENSTITQNSFLEGDIGSRFDTGILMLPVYPEIPARFISIKNNTIADHRSAGILAIQFPKTNIQNNEISENSVGVFLFGGNDCSSILNNTFLHNDLAVLDFDFPSTTLLANNQAFDNGVGESGTTYDVFYNSGPTPTTSGTLDAYPALPTVTNENVETLGSCAPVAKKYQDLTAKIKSLIKKPKRKRTRRPLSIPDDN